MKLAGFTAARAPVNLALRQGCSVVPGSLKARKPASSALQQAIIEWHGTTKATPLPPVFCFATFEDFDQKETIHNKATLLKMPGLLRQAGASRITFVGNKPFLHPLIDELIKEAKTQGLITAAVTNGSCPTPSSLESFAPHLEWLAFSVDASTKDMHAKAQGVGLLDLLHEPSWRAVLKDEFDKPHFKCLQAFVDGELAAAGVKVYPPKEHIFRAFNCCPFNEVKVVIIGQDPYHGPDQAKGLSFSVPPGVKVPPSLQNIFEELKADLGCPIPNHGDLETWASQGVLLLNAVLTVRAGVANSHSNKGWEQLTDAAIRQLNQQQAGIVFLLWGRLAQEKAKLIDASKHHVLMAAHPSPLSAHMGFHDCRHFSKANALLELSSREPINWCIERV